LFTAQGNILPGSPAFEYHSFAQIFEPLGCDTPGNAALRQEVRAVTRVDLPSPNFDIFTASVLDQCQRLLRPSQLLALARILKLDTSGAPAVAATDRPSATRAGPISSAPAGRYSAEELPTRVW
jgi:hypothetical protein